MNFRYFKHWLRYFSIQSIVALMSIFLSTALAQASSKGAIDWIIVVDTSGSMRGAGGTKNIFNQVKNSITDFVNTAQLGDTVTIYSFDKDVTLQTQNIPINSNSNRGQLKQIIASLKADGVRTHTGKAVQKALQHSALLNQRSDALGRTVSILFLTDGVEDVSGIPNPVPIPDNTILLPQQQCKPYIFFVSLGLKEHEKQLNNFANNPALCGKGRVLRDPGGVELNRLAQNIRPVLVEPKLDVNLPAAKLPLVSPGTITESFNIKGMSNVKNTVSLKLEDPKNTGIRLVSNNNKIDLAANKEISIPIRLQIPADVQGGVSGLRLVLASENKAIAPITVDLPVTIKAKLQIQPTKIDFGSVEVGKTTSIQTLVVRSNISGNAKLQLQESQKISVVQPNSPVSLQVGETKIPLQLQVADNNSEGDRTFTLQLIPENPIASPMAASVQLNVLIPLWRKIIVWSLLILLLLLIALIIVCLIQRKTPLELLQDIRTRKNLEGALIILSPPPKSSEDEEISLTNLYKSKVCLSDIIPVIAGTDSDAELVTVREAGQKNIDLRCLKGNIFINSKEVTTDELYDEDIIEIGNVKLQFNWIEHQRQTNY
ncbi:VWA domain-containing protein [Calothrix sp. CCY 0018]|uniref:VWA domain-containing protein n=1 Tax=Calothrix sp. CCY 0018 TaxID=3103864 RepID=UPI0039C6F572